MAIILSFTFQRAYKTSNDKSFSRQYKIVKLSLSRGRQKNNIIFDFLSRYFMLYFMIFILQKCCIVKKIQKQVNLKNK